MLTPEQRKDKIKVLGAQIADMRAEDKAANFFDEPIYDNAIKGLQSAIAYQKPMTAQDC